MSITETDIKKLASLSRINLSDDETKQFAGEIESILHYVEQIKEVSASVDSSTKTPSQIPHRNALREDVSGTNLNGDPKVVINEAPTVEDGYIKVKKILG
jgi:aspartyl-tRNA(Asn)/glutamyl-tRNA(Gln) amidotransferase subunit C